MPQAFTGDAMSAPNINNLRPESEGTDYETRQALAWGLLVNSLLLPASTEGLVELHETSKFVTAGQFHCDCRGQNNTFFLGRRLNLSGAD
jgi:hypothetical protein